MPASSRSSKAPINLVVVESPAKARTISRILGKDFVNHRTYLKTVITCDMTDNSLVASTSSFEGGGDVATAINQAADGLTLYTGGPTATNPFANEVTALELEAFLCRFLEGARFTGLTAGDYSQTEKIPATFVGP